MGDPTLAQSMQRLRSLQPDQQRLRGRQRGTHLDELLQPHGRRRVDQARRRVEFPVQQRQDMQVLEPTQLLEPGLHVGGGGHDLGVEIRDLHVLLRFGIPRLVGPAEASLDYGLADAVAARDQYRLRGGVRRCHRLLSCGLLSGNLAGGDLRGGDLVSSDLPTGDVRCGDPRYRLPPRLHLLRCRQEVRRSRLPQESRLPPRVLSGPPLA